MRTVFETGWPVRTKIGYSRASKKPKFVRTGQAHGQSEQILTLGAHACCNPNIFGEIFEILSVHKSQIFGNFHQALPPIFRGPRNRSAAMSISHQSTSADESLWQATNADIAALQQIVSSHFQTDCQHYTCMNDGAYARAFLFSLVTGIQVVGRVILPVCESIKTEAEVTMMELVRGNQIVHSDPIAIFLRFNICPIYLARGGVPVPQVYLYCSTPNNPVRAEWIIMEYMSGKLFGDCIESLTDQQKRRTSTDLAGIMFALFQITAPQCGSLLRLPNSGLHDYQDNQSLRQCALRYPTHSRGITLGSNLHCVPAPQEYLSIGPINDITFLDYPRQLPPRICGPFNESYQQV